MMVLSKRVARYIKIQYQKEGELWVENFDRLIEYCKKKWSLKFKNMFESNYNFVAAALLANGREVVVKLSYPSEEFRSEVEALLLFNGNGIAKVIDMDVERGILIIERIVPGYTLASVKSNDEATLIAANVMINLWQKAPVSSLLQTTFSREKQLTTMSTSEGLPVGKDIISEAVDVFHQLNSSIEEIYLLHGDLHHFNILKNERDSWVSIDPKGLIGEREYDVIQFLLNQLPDKQRLETIEKRIDIFVSELGLNRERLLLWGFCHSVLATCWSAVDEEGKYDTTFYSCIDIFKQLQK